MEHQTDKNTAFLERIGFIQDAFCGMGGFSKALVGSTTVVATVCIFALLVGTVGFVEAIIVLLALLLLASAGAIAFSIAKEKHIRNVRGNASLCAKCFRRHH